MKAAPLRPLFARILLPAFALAAVTGAARGQEDLVPPTPEPVVVVPYDESRPVEDQVPRSYYLDYGTFETLWNRAARTRGLAGNPPEQSGAVLVEALHEIVWEENRLLAHARYRLSVSGTDWVRVPFSFAGAVVGTVLVDGSPAAYDSGHLLVKETGWHAVEVRYEVPVSAGGRDAAWEVPPAVAGLLRVRGMESVPTVNGGLPVSVVGEEDGPVVTAVLGNRGKVSLAVPAAVRVPEVNRPRLAQVESLLGVSPGLASVESEISLEFPGHEIGAFAVEIEAGYTPVRLEVPGLDTWKLVQDSGSPSRLEFGLSAPASGGLSFRLVAEAPVPVDGGEIPFPRIRPDAARVEAVLVPAGSGTVEVIALGDTADRRVEISPRLRERSGGARLAGAFRSNLEDGALALAIRRMTVRHPVRADYVHHLSPVRGEAFVEAAFPWPAGPGVMRVGLPPDSRIRELVPASGLRRWWRNGDDLWLQRDAAGEDSPCRFLLSLVIGAAGASGTVGLPELGWPADCAVSGDVLVVAHAATGTGLRTTGPGEIRPLDPGSALGRFAVLPPFERRHAFSYAGGPAGAVVATEEITPVFDAGVVLSATVRETWLQLVFHLEIEVKRSALGQVRVELPLEVPGLRWEGASLREARSTDEGRKRIYHLAFQEDVTGLVELTATTELPLVRGGARLPRLEVPGARQSSQHAVLQGRFTDGLETNLVRVEEVPGETLPHLPRSMNNPRFFRMSGTDWFFGVGWTKLESVGGIDAVITGTGIVTALRENGEEWHHVTYRLRNHALRFLPVRLENGLEVVRTRVAARDVPPRLGETSPTHETILLPLEANRDEELPVLVELVLRRPPAVDASLGDRFRVRMRAPELEPGAPAEAQTFWEVYLPAGYSGYKIGGPVNQIPAEQHLLSRIGAEVEEMERLARVARSGADPAMAWRNLAALADHVDGHLIPALDASGSARDRLPEWGERIRSLGEEAAAFRPEADRAVSVAPHSDSPSPGHPFTPNNPETIDRMRRAFDARRERVDTFQGLVKLNDFVGVRPVQPSPGFVPGSGNPDATVPGEGFGFSGAQTEAARRLLGSWTLAQGTRFATTRGGFWFGNSGDTAALPVGEARIETIEVPRQMPAIDASGIRERLLPEVAFPVEGHPMVFHKLKGSARLEIEGFRENRRDLPLVWGGFLASLLAIRLLAWALGKRRRPGAPRSAPLPQ